MFKEATRRFCEKEVAPLVEGAEATGKVTECLLSEELNRACAGIAAALMVQGGSATALIYRFGSGALNQRILLQGMKGGKIGAFGLTEPDARSGAAGIQGSTFLS